MLGEYLEGGSKEGRVLLYEFRRICKGIYNVTNKQLKYGDENGENNKRGWRYRF